MAAGSAALVLIGELAPWQKSLFGISANGIEVAPAVLIPALLLTGYALYLYDRGRDSHRTAIGWLLIGAATLIGIAVLGNAQHIGGLVLVGWGPATAGVGGAGLLIVGVSLLRADSLTP